MNTKFLTLFVFLGLIALSQQSGMAKIKKFLEHGFDIIEHPFGHHQVPVAEDETLIVSTGQDIRTDADFASTYDEKLEMYGKNYYKEEILHCHKAKHPNFFQMLAWPMGVIGNTGDATVELETNHDSCYKSISVTYTKTSDSSYTLKFHGQHAIGLTCINAIQFSTALDFHMPVIMTIVTGTHTVKVENQSAEQMEQVEKWGIHIFQTCDKVVNLIGDLKKTASLFIGGLSSDPKGEGIWNSKPTQNQTLANIDFITAGAGYTYPKRKNNYFIDIQERDLHNGDLLLITRFDGVDELIAWAAGGRVGHTCVVVTIDGKKMVVESQDGWYWPKHGIQRNTWSQWKEWAQNAGFNVILVPLNDQKRAILDKNIDKAVKYFESMEGLPYGYHNFLFGWLDDVNKNVPPITTIDYIFVVFAQLEKALPEVVTQFMGEALNMRLGTKNLTLPQIASVVHDRNMTMAELYSIPEQDDWVYSDGPSRVCSSFIISLYKAAGLFEGHDIQGSEFTPRDLYQMNFYDKSGSKRPSKCKATDPNLPYCQIMGNYTIDITNDGWSTVEPYDKMFERCPSEPPLFQRVTSGPNAC